MKTYYCHESFRPGFTCLDRTPDGRCAGGRFCICESRSTTPKYIGIAPPMPKVKQASRKSTDCALCIHNNICKLKNKNKEADYYEQQTPKQNSKYRVE